MCSKCGLIATPTAKSRIDTIILLFLVSIQASVPFSARSDWHREFSDGLILVKISALVSMAAGMTFPPMPLISGLSEAVFYQAVSGRI